MGEKVKFARSKESTKELIVLSDVQQEIFDKVKSEWEKKLEEGKKQGKYKPDVKISDGMIKRVIILADVQGDGKKRVSLIGSDKTHLVPIEDLILKGLSATDLDKYPAVKESTTTD